MKRPDCNGTFSTQQPVLADNLRGVLGRTSASRGAMYGLHFAAVAAALVVVELSLMVVVVVIIIPVMVIMPTMLVLIELRGEGGQYVFSR